MTWYMKWFEKLKVINALLIIVGAATFLSSCKPDKNHPGYEYMPDMAHSRAYETYGENKVFADGLNARLPVAGTVPRGFDPYPYPNTKDGYNAAGDSLKNPLAKTTEVLAMGKVLYEKNCIYCHGATGNADGILIQKKKFPPPPPFASEILNFLSEGKIYHSITYGKNLMGSHAAQLNSEERWKVVYYVQTLQKR